MPITKAANLLLKEHIKNSAQYGLWRKENPEIRKFIPQHPEKTWRNSWLGWNNLEEMAKK